MPKGDRSNPGEEFLYKLSLKPEFQLDLINARKRLEIPDNGFSNGQEKTNRFKQPLKIILFISTLESLSRDYKIPKPYIGILDRYVCFNDVFSKKQGLPDVASIEPPAGMLKPTDINMESYYWESAQPYAKLLIFGSSRKSDVIKFIEKNWNKVEEILKKQGWTRPKTVRRTLFKKRNQRIKELYMIRSVEELQKIADPEGDQETSTKQRYLLIQNILRKEGYGEVDDGYIRKMGSKK